MTDDYGLASSVRDRNGPEHGRPLAKSACNGRLVKVLTEVRRGAIAIREAERPGAVTPIADGSNASVFERRHRSELEGGREQHGFFDN